MPGILEGLDSIDWSTLHHAFGTAGDVPELIRALLSEDSARRSEAVHELFTNISHQGSVYEATGYAVPFLIELMESPLTPDRTWVALLLAAIAGGSGYLEVHCHHEWVESVFRDKFAKEGTTLEAQLEIERKVIESVREQSVKALPLIAAYLSHAEPEIRLTVAETYGAFPDLRDTYLPVLELALADEANDEVREVIERSIIRLKYD